MTLDDVGRDPLVQAVARLPLVDGDPRRAEGVRARCRNRLSVAGTPRARRAAASGLESLVPAAIGLLFLADVVRRAIALYGR